MGMQAGSARARVPLCGWFCGAKGDGGRLLATGPVLGACLRLLAVGPSRRAKWCARLCAPSRPLFHTRSREREPGKTEKPAKPRRTDLMAYSDLLLRLPLSNLDVRLPPFFFFFFFDPTSPIFGAFLSSLSAFFAS